MPDPFEFLNAIIAAAVASVMIVIGFRVAMQARAVSVCDLCGIVALGVGLLTGCCVLRFAWTWPPSTALDRFLTIVLPASLTIEFVAAIIATNGRTRQATRDNVMTTSEARHRKHVGLFLFYGNGIVRVARFLLFLLAGRILLHGSVYLKTASIESTDSWSIAQQLSILIVGAIVLLASRSSLIRLSQRTGSASIVFSISLAVLAAGCATMMAGYIKGGAAALPFAAALLAISMGSRLVLFSRKTSSRANLEFVGIIRVGLLGLYSFLWIGRFFGQVSSISAIVIFISPLLCWISETPLVRSMGLKQKAMIRCVAVAIPLAIVLWVAKSEFDQKLGRLLVHLVMTTEDQIQPFQSVID